MTVTYLGQCANWRASEVQLSQWEAGSLGLRQVRAIACSYIDELCFLKDVAKVSNWYRASPKRNGDAGRVRCAWKTIGRRFMLPMKQAS